MRAFVLHRYGDPSATRLTNLPELATPGAGEVMVAIRAAGLNPLDFKIRQGKLRAILRLKLPWIMGHEVAGEVQATGPDVTDLHPGDRVFARLGKAAGGALAERVTTRRAYLARSPATVDDTAAAAVPLAGLTALQALRDLLKLQPGQRVLISGGAGGVGSFAIQLAKWLGAHVTTTASPRGAELVRALGADEVIDYTTQRIDALPRSFDAGFDLIGGETLTQMFAVMKPGSTVVSVADTPEPQTALQDLGGGRLLAAVFWFLSRRTRSAARAHGLRYRFLFMRPDGEGLTLLARLIDEGKLRVILDRSFPLEQAAEALAYLETGRAKGKVVVTVG